MGALLRHRSPSATMPRLFVQLAFVTTLMLGAASTAAAHVPALEPGSSGGTVTIGGPEVSRATYGYLAPGEPYDEYRFTVTEPVSQAVGIIVPAYPEHAGFRPKLVITSTEGGPVEIPDPGEEPREGEYEPFSLTTFWRGGEQEAAFEPGVTYVLRVEPGEGDRSGRYVVVFGGPERFEAADVRATLIQLPAIWFGAYGGAPLRFNALGLIPIGLAALVLAAVVAGVWWLLSRRRRDGEVAAAHLDTDNLSV